MIAPLAEVTRGNHVESRHSGVVVVADSNGTVLRASGDPGTFAYFRSSAKPFQAIPFVESGAIDAFGFTEAELALVCASHTAELRHQEQVAVMLEKLGLRPQELLCGIPLPWNQKAAAAVLDGRIDPSPLQCDCSGKHSGMLATCCHMGYALDTYLDPQHPLQREILSIISSICRYPEQDIAIAPDGCSLPTFGMPVWKFAVAYATLAAPETSSPEHAPALDRIRAAMTAHPYNVGGAGIFASDLMDVFDGDVVAKNGAEGLLCIGIPAEGVGIAIRVADGSFRSHPPVALQVLADFDAIDASKLETLAARYPTKITNHNDWHVGDIKSVVELHAVDSPA